MRYATMLLALVVVLVAAPAWADFEAGAEAHDRGDYVTALKEWRPLAEQGDAKAQVNLGWMYLNGHGIPQDDKEAMLWYRLAAAQGDAEAQFNLGAMYAEGLGVSQDDEQAVQWFRLRPCPPWSGQPLRSSRPCSPWSGRSRRWLRPCSRFPGPL